MTNKELLKKFGLEIIEFSTGTISIRINPNKDSVIQKRSKNKGLTSTDFIISTLVHALKTDTRTKYKEGVEIR